MRDSQEREGSMSFRTFAVIAAAFVLTVAILTWGPWSAERVPPNPGPSGTPGSTTLNQTPPPAAGPSETTGAAR
jgi:cytochrome c-type biogenesis protein CcmH/NrfG